MNEYISKGKAPLVVAQDPDGRALPHRPPQRQPAGVAEHLGRGRRAALPARDAARVARAGRAAHVRRGRWVAKGRDLTACQAELAEDACRGRGCRPITTSASASTADAGGGHGQGASRAGEGERLRGSEACVPRCAAGAVGYRGALALGKEHTELTGCVHASVRRSSTTDGRADASLRMPPFCRIRRLSCRRTRPSSRRARGPRRARACGGRGVATRRGRGGGVWSMPMVPAVELEYVHHRMHEHRMHEASACTTLQAELALSHKSR